MGSVLACGKNSQVSVESHKTSNAMIKRRTTISPLNEMKDNCYTENHELKLSNEDHFDSNAVKPLSRVSCSHGDLQMKSSVGTANLLCDSKIPLTRKEVQESKRSYSKENLKVSKRKKRIPTRENAIHVLEADQVNCYQLMEEIGRGSFGSVFKCLCHKDNCFYAMKIISKKRLMRKNGLMARNPRATKNNPLAPLNREIAILKKMDHPNVVKLIEVIEDTQVDNVYMVFELIKNGVVMEVPSESVITEEKARQYFRDLVLGIEYLHYSKIIHRDIKPSNLLLDESDHIKIADFGVSDMFEGEDDSLNKYAGSPAFQAPEVLDHRFRDKYSGKAADVWSMGITLYCFLYGQCPFFSADLSVLVQLIKTESVEFPNEPILSPQVHDLISRMLSKEPNERISILEIKTHPWVTEGDTSPLPSTLDHCSVIEVTDDEVRNSIKVISKLSSLVLAKNILKGKSFVGNARLKT
ncbi:calcium/calmodulin-dependent protein kinase kinase 2 isoform X2 [Hydra vulgaris]|uniref:Calcium/calmodulin-dependent protein kinase kinase 2 isoform X2 n=1 Tax=Hydra vulgaris TaxID=6087 RepID=A0ABM4CP39_HYDVU